jgi:hypothetical protein
VIVGNLGLSDSCRSIPSFIEVSKSSLHTTLSIPFSSFFFFEVGLCELGNTVLFSVPVLIAFSFLGEVYLLSAKVFLSLIENPFRLRGVFEAYELSLFPFFLLISSI